MATSLVTMEQLPDDVLVMVMRFLSVEDLLACRLVCKTLCGLALHRDVWRHRSLQDDEPHAGAVLHLAPCLNKLTVTGRVPTLAASTTRCAAASLELYSDDEVTYNPAEYALAVRNQESLGRLRRLQLSCPNYNERKTGNDVLMRTVASCSGLESMEVFHEIPDTIYPVVHGPPRPSLKYFRMEMNSGDNAAFFMDTILAGHAATLERVNLEGSDDLDESTADVLASMPRLRCLRCEATMAGLEAVAACKALRDITICLGDDLDQVDSVSKFIRRASQLRRVYLENSEYSGDFSAEHFTMLVDALASAGAGRSRLEQLALQGFGGFKDMRPLFRALPSLTTLRHLDLEAEADDELLKSITPVTAPALRLLDFWWGKCPHAWIHSVVVKETLAENPSLHILLWCDIGDKCDPQDCEACAIGCHGDVNWGVVKKIGLYSHDPAKCPSPRDHGDDDDWQRYRGREINVACPWIRL